MSKSMRLRGRKVTNIVSKDGKHTYPVDQRLRSESICFGRYIVKRDPIPMESPMSQAIQVNKSAPGSVSLVGGGGKCE